MAEEEKFLGNYANVDQFTQLNLKKILLATKASNDIPGRVGHCI